MTSKKTVIVDGDELTVYGGGAWFIDKHGNKWASAGEYRHFKARRPRLPTVEHKKNDPMGGTRETHPAFALISASRCTTTGQILFGSDFKHGSFVQISISRAELNRSLSKDWPHPREELVRVMLSEAQWATFVSSLNNGIGVQCTLDSRLGDPPVPGIDINQHKREQFKAEMSDHLVEAEKHVAALQKMVDEGRLPKVEVRSLLTQIRNNLTSGANFVAKSFGEHVENTVEHAKIEVEAYMQNVLQRAGVKALAEQQGALRMTDGDDEDKT